MKLLILPVLAYLILSVLLGCTHQQQVSQALNISGQAAELHAESELRWYSTCFYMDFEENGDINWVTDLIIADLILAPVLEEKQKQLPGWRLFKK